MKEQEIVEVGIASESSAVKAEESHPPAVIPLLGLIVDLNRPAEVASAIKAVRDAKQKLDTVRAELERVLAEEAARLGTKTLNLDGIQATVYGGPEAEYDIEELEKLLDAGLPQERYDELVKTTVTYKVDRNVIRQLVGSGNEQYVRIIEHAARHVERPYRVSVR